MNLMLGMSYYDFFPAIQKLSEIFTSFSDVWTLFLYPIVYILVVPLTFKLPSKYFSACNLFSWVLLLVDVLMKLFWKTQWSMILGNLFVVFCSAMMLPAYSVVKKRSRNEEPSFFMLTFGFLAHPLGMGLRLTSSGIIPETFVYVLKLLIINIVIVLVIIRHLSSSENHSDENDEKLVGFVESVKFVCKDQNLFIVSCCTSAQIGLIYGMSTVFESFYLKSLINFEVTKSVAEEYVKILGVVYSITVIIGAFISVWLQKSVEPFGVLARLYSVFPFVLIFFLGFVLRGLVFYLFYCVLSGLSLLQLIGIMHYSCLGYQEKLTKNSVLSNPGTQPVTLIISTYFGLIFAVIVKFLMSICVTYGWHRSSLFAVIQLLISTSFLAIYDDYDNQFSKIKKTSRKL
jgi:hypothetical protein